MFIGHLPAGYLATTSLLGDALARAEAAFWAWKLTGGDAPGEERAA